MNELDHVDSKLLGRLLDVLGEVRWFDVVLVECGLYLDVDGQEGAPLFEMVAGRRDRLSGCGLGRVSQGVLRRQLPRNRLDLTPAGRLARQRRVAWPPLQDSALLLRLPELHSCSLLHLFLAQLVTFDVLDVLNAQN